MTNKVKDVRIKDHTYCFFNDIINIKISDLNNIKRDEKKKKKVLFTTLLMQRSKIRNTLKLIG